MNDAVTIVRPSPNQLRAWAADPANAQCWGLDLIADEIERLRLSLSEETTGRTTDLARWEQERDSLEATIAEQRRSLADQRPDGDERCPLRARGVPPSLARGPRAQQGQR